MLWAIANVGMAGGVIGWLALDAARPRWAAVLGGALAVLGYLIRIGVSIVLIVNQDAAVDTIIVASIPLTFAGMAVLGIASLRGKQLTGGRSWAPLLTVAAGLMAASFYSTNRAVHFVLLGLLWGPTWMLVGVLVLNAARKRVRDAHRDIGKYERGYFGQHRAAAMAPGLLTTAVILEPSMAHRGP